MFSRRLHLLTANLLLVLVGLVGALGTGLHDVFDCCHHCQQCSDCRTYGLEDQPTNPTSKDLNCSCVFCDASPTESGTISNLEDGNPRHALSRSAADCAICQLLFHFLTTTTNSSWEQSVFEERGIIALTIPSDVSCSSHRLEPPRGPPGTTTGC